MSEWRRPQLRATGGRERVSPGRLYSTQCPAAQPRHAGYPLTGSGIHTDSSLPISLASFSVSAQSPVAASHLLTVPAPLSTPPQFLPCGTPWREF